MTIMFDYTKTLSELEGITMEEPEFKSSLTLKCYQLYNTPLCEYEAGDCRIMIGQQFGLKYLVPLALEILEDNILMDGGLYSGDLIDAFLNVDKKFWRENNEWYNETIGLIDKAVEKLNVIKRKMVYD